MAVYNRIYSSTADTYGEATSPTYSISRGGTASTSGFAASLTGPVTHTFTGSNYICRQVFLVFDTSAVPSGSGTGLFSIDVGSGGITANADTVRFSGVSSVANKIAGASLAALTHHSSPGTFPTASGRYTAAVTSVAAIPRSATFNVVIHSVGEENGSVAPTGTNNVTVSLADTSGTTSDPFLQLYLGSPWEFVGVSNEVAVATTAHALVTTGISGTLQAGDLLIACITSRIASTTSVTLPTGGEWTLVAEQKNNNTAATSSALPSGLMAYCVRGASNPNLTFTHPVAPSQAQGRIVAYRNVNTTSPKDTQTSFTTATGTTAVSGTGLTTTQIEDLIVAMACGGQEAAWSAFNATDPAGASGATDTTSAPTTTWIERADSLVTTGADGSLAIFDAVKLTSGATGNLTATASVSAGHVVVAGAFKIAAAAVTGTGTPAGQAGTVASAGVSSSDGTGTPVAQAAAVSGTGTAGSAEATGTGAATADASVVGGSGVSASSGTVALAAQAATAAGVGASKSSGAGALAAQTATVSGAGAVASSGTGALGAQAATVAASGLSVSTGTGALDAAAATATGEGALVSTGTGSFVAGSAEVAGEGTVATGNTGALVADAATVAGLGVSVSIGTGAAQAGAAAVAGAGLSVSTGTGTLLAGSTTVTGEGVVLEDGAAVGTGALVAGAATVAGAGEVTGEVAPPIFVGGGHFRPQPRRPLPVEGVGYGILPEFEGEAHGLVVVAGTGVAFLPRVGGGGAGTVDVAGRSAAWLAVKVAAIGARGQAGAGDALLEGLSVAGEGVAGARGSGSGAILLKGAATGQHDDDEAAIMALLLAA